MSYALLGADGRPQQSDEKGQWGGHRGTKIYGRLDCPSALRALARGGYARQRVFFADEATAVAAGYRPCATCCRERYDAWRAGQASSLRGRGHGQHAVRTAGSGGDDVFGGLAAGVKVPVEAGDVVGFLELGAFGGAWRAGDPCADRDMAGVDPLAG